MGSPRSQEGMLSETFGKEECKPHSFPLHGSASPLKHIDLPPGPRSSQETEENQVTQQGEESGPWKLKR